MYWGYHYWGMHLFWWMFWLAIVVVLLATGWPRSRIGARDAGRDAALDALRMRYAAGEIDEEEYQERLAVLTGARRAAPTPPDRGRGDRPPSRVPDDGTATGSGANGRDPRTIGEPRGR
ncbi:MAG TPA: SHOCT domain-containing protein [Kofleriaceae bacterium]|jgi:putative membrane protein|nr:SHOCT domain-containing protein [Kofleriaceae bacterium]